MVGHRYLTHIMVIDFLFNTLTESYDFTIYLASYIFVANYVLAVAMAVVLWFLVEKPFANLMPMILAPRGRSADRGGAKTGNTTGTPMAEWSPPLPPPPQQQQRIGTKSGAVAETDFTISDQVEMEAMNVARME